ncbi:hypothetical protein Celaphus_00017497, partial [Cervus elaphus hippelaphus]
MTGGISYDGKLTLAKFHFGSEICLMDGKLPLIHLERALKLLVTNIQGTVSLTVANTLMGNSDCHFRGLNLSTLWFNSTKILVGKYYIIKELPVSLSLEAGTDAVDIETIQ